MPFPPPLHPLFLSLSSRTPLSLTQCKGLVEFTRRFPALVDTVQCLVRGANALQVPVIVTEQVRKISLLYMLYERGTVTNLKRFN
jgi:hypothetical protein